MDVPQALAAWFERTLASSAEERMALGALPVSLETRRSGAGVVSVGDRPSRSFMGLAGLLGTSKSVVDGGSQIMCFHVPGAMPDLLHLDVMDSDMRALADCQLGFMAHHDLRRLCDQNSRLATLLWRTTLVDAAIYREWVVNVGQRLAPSRIAHVFCELMLRMQAAGLARGRSCHLGLTQEALGQATGRSLVHVNRTLQDLRGQGLISFGQGRLTIHDWDRLVAVGDVRADYLHIPGGGAA